MIEGGKTLAIGGVAALLGAGAAALALGAADKPVNTADRAEIEKIVREYILNHPEILPEAMRNLQARESAKAIDANRAAIETPFAGAWEGAADADVTIVEFFDYACGYCRAALPDVQRLLSEDKKLKIVYREMPVLGQESLDAARVSLVAAQMGKYPAFHRALFGNGRPSAATISKAQQAAGMDAAAVRAALAKPDIDAELRKGMELQQALNLEATPSWIVGDQLFVGAVGYERLKQAVAEARAAKSGS